LVNEVNEETADTQLFSLTTTVANGGTITGKISFEDAVIKTWSIKATIGDMSSATPVPISANEDNVFSELEWNFTVLDICAQPGIL
jgi:hypothetical protein